MMNKDVLAGILDDEAETFLVIEPFHFTVAHTTTFQFAEARAKSPPTAHRLELLVLSKNEHQPRQKYQLSTLVFLPQVAAGPQCVTEWNPNPATHRGRSSPLVR